MLDFKYDSIIDGTLLLINIKSCKCIRHLLPTFDKSCYWIFIRKSNGCKPKCEINNFTTLKIK